MFSCLVEEAIEPSDQDSESGLVRGASDLKLNEDNKIKKKTEAFTLPIFLVVYLLQLAEDGFGFLQETNEN